MSDVNIAKIGGIAFGAITLACFALGSFGFIPTGDVGVRTTNGQINTQTVQPGLYFKAPMISSVENFNVKETTVDAKNLRPKAADNLTLADFDATVYYEVNPASIAYLVSKYKGQTRIGDDGTNYAGEGIVSRSFFSAINEAVAVMPSLTIHTKREELAAAIKQRMQDALNKSDPGVFKVNRVLVQSVVTDPSIEQSIQQAVQAQKQLEKMNVQKQIAQAEADIAITKATGEATANQKLAASLTPAFLAHERNQALMNAAASGASKTVILQGGATPLINAN